MIIIGYQGIGKSTLSKKRSDFIDLESGNFWIPSPDDGKPYRHDDWYKAYCNIVDHLSKQGYYVFTSSHEVVRNYIKKVSDEPIVAVVPAIELKDKWIQKLQERYDSTKSDKDFKALANAKDRYEDNIREIMDSDIPVITLTDIDYNLESVITSYYCLLTLGSYDVDRKYVGYEVVLPSGTTKLGGVNFKFK